MNQYALKATLGLSMSLIAAATHAGTATTSIDADSLYLIVDGGINMAMNTMTLAVLNGTKTTGLTSFPGVTAQTTQINPTTNVTKLTSLNFTLPTVAVNYDDLSGRILSEDLGGSITFNVATANSATTGGSLTLSNLRVDFVRNQLTGTVNGANGVGLKNNVALWSLTGNHNFTMSDAVTPMAWHAPCGIGNDGTYTCQDFMGSFLDLNKLALGPSDMVLTPEANALWAQSLGYNDLGQKALGTVSSTTSPFGTLTSAVPEAGTWSMMSLGLIGLWATRRRAACTA